MNELPVIPSRCLYQRYEVVESYDDAIDLRNSIIEQLQDAQQRHYGLATDKPTYNFSLTFEPLGDLYAVCGTLTFYEPGPIP